MSREPIGSTVEEESTGKWVNPLVWTLLVVAGLLVFELTLQPGLAAPVMCAKFGWNDFRTAQWLRRRDPVRPRGWVCFWFYLASALWKIVITATVTMLAFAFALIVWGGAAKPGPPGLEETSVVAVAGLMLSSLTLLAAVALAFCFRIRVWLDPAVDRSRVENRWPPRHFGTNRVRRLLLVAALSLFLGCLGPVLRVFVPGIVFGPDLTPLLVCGGVAIGLTSGLARKVVAETPEQCWPRDAFTEHDVYFDSCRDAGKVHDQDLRR